MIPGVVFFGSSTGTVYAYSTADGKALWQFDTAREFETVNGVPAKGGNINAAGPVVAGRHAVRAVRLFRSRRRRARERAPRVRAEVKAGRPPSGHRPLLRVRRPRTCPCRSVSRPQGSVERAANPAHPPTADHHRRHRIADQVRNGPRFRHESALPRIMEKLEHLGCSKPVVGLTIPTGYPSIWTARIVAPFGTLHRSDETSVPTLSQLD